MMIRFATWLNTWLPAYGWAVWFSQEQRLPDEYSPDAEPATYKLVPTGRMKMRIGRYP